ncbi:MAG: JAB domain-containing protein [Flavipsychrobacter sp.]|nr:JAB domain-containing protein [Flavipsychrobacter sp.]
MESTAKIPNWNQVSEVELCYKNKVKVADRPRIDSSRTAAELLRNGWNENTLDLQERFKVLFLNRSNHVIAGMELSIGGIVGTVADPRLIFVTALKANACALIICHNHPSGNLLPSKADEELTRKIKQGGVLLDIRLLDHVILTSEGYYSFADEGLL